MTCPKCSSKVVIESKAKKSTVEYKCLFCGHKFEVDKHGKQ